MAAQSEGVPRPFIGAVGPAYASESQRIDGMHVRLAEICVLSAVPFSATGKLSSGGQLIGRRGLPVR